MAAEILLCQKYSESELPVDVKSVTEDLRSIIFDFKEEFIKVRGGDRNVTKLEEMLHKLNPDTFHSVREEFGRFSHNYRYEITLRL